MKKLFAIIFSAVIISASAFAISGCGCSNKDTANQPATDIVGDWGGRSDDIEAEFNDDGSCVIGGVTGTYKIDENNNLILTPNSSEETAPESQTFEYYSDSNTSAIQPNQWTVVDNVLYINGQQYNGITNNTTSSNTQGGNADNQNSSADSSSGVASNQGSGNSTDVNNNNNNNNNSSSASSSANSSDSSSSSSSSSSNSSSSSSSSAPENLDNDEDETPVADIVENIDDF